MTPAETEKAPPRLVQKAPPARDVCHFPKPPQRHEVYSFPIYYKGALVQEYYDPKLLTEFEATAREKGIWSD